MRTSAHVRFHWSWLVILFAAALIIVPDAVMAGCGGGHRGGQGGGHHRRHGNPGANDNDSDGHHGRRWHRHGGPGDGGVDVEVGIGTGDGGPGDYGVPGGRIGPPTRACAEAQHLRAELNRALNLRRSAESGRRVLMPGNDGRYDIVNTARYRRENEQRIALGGRSAGSSAADIVQLQKSLDDARDTTLRILDGEISDIQDRLGQLDYECQ